MDDSENEGSLFSRVSGESFEDFDAIDEVAQVNSSKIGRAESEEDKEESDVESEDFEKEASDTESLESAQHMTKSKTREEKLTNKTESELGSEEESDADKDTQSDIEPVEITKVSQNSTDKLKFDPTTFIIAKHNRTTSRIMTLYELSAVIGTHATQIDKGVAPFVDYSDLTRSDYMAIREIYKKRCPLSIHRQTRRGIEYWEVNEMVVPASYNIPSGIL